MFKKIFPLMLATLLFAGCGGPKPHPFNPKTRPLAESVKDAVKKKKVDMIEKALTLAETYRTQGVMVSGEYEVLKSVLDYAQKDKWEEAADLIEKSIQASK